MRGATLAACEAACDSDEGCSGFTFSTMNTPNFCYLKADAPYFGWCNTTIGPCTGTACFHAKAVLPDGYYVARVAQAPFGLAACQAACAADLRGMHQIEGIVGNRSGSLVDCIDDTQHAALTAVLLDLDVFVSFTQQHGGR